MNNYSIKYKLTPNGIYKTLPGVITYPLSVCNLLDERLDECEITTYEDTTEIYKPTTFFEITVNNTNIYHFILANDNSEEFPKGSKKYKHTLSLIELTKWLEGFFCASLTFTNGYGNLYLNNPIQVISQEGAPTPIPDDYLGLDIWYGEDYPEYIKTDKLLSPQEIGGSIVLPSPKEIGALCSSQKVGTWNVVEFLHTDVNVYTNITYKIGNAPEIVVNYDSETRPVSQGLTIDNVKDNITVTYCVLFSEANSTLRAVTWLKFDIAMTSQRYPLQKWTVTRAVNRVLECAEPLLKGENPRFRFDGIRYTNGEAGEPTQNSQADKYRNVLIPEITLTNCTLREQLKVIGSFIHAEPRLKERGGGDFYIFFDKYGNNEKYDLTGTTIYKQSTIDINNYCTEIRSHAQNIVSSLQQNEGVCEYPYRNGEISLRTEQSFVRITEQNGVIQTLHPIYEIQSVKCGFYQGENLVIPMCDITNYVFEYTKYSILSSFSGEYPNSKSYALSYKLGSKSIDGLFYKAPNVINSDVFSEFAIVNILSRCTDELPFNKIKDLITKSPENLVFEVIYKPITNNFLSHEKQLEEKGIAPFQKLYNQSENLVEATYYGENIKGVVSRLGNIDKTLTVILKNIDNLPKVSQNIDGYVISAVYTELMPLYVKCTISLTKDFNRISQYVGINSVKHMFEISERQTYERDILIKEKLIIGGEYPENPEPSKNIFNSVEPFYQVLNSDTRENKTKITVAYVEGRSKRGTYNDLIPVTNGKIKTNGYLAPIVPRAFGNTLIFSFKPKDNYSAGTMAEYIETDDGIKGRWSNEARYTDYYGRVYWLGFWLLSDFSQTEENKRYLAFRYPMETLTGLNDKSIVSVNGNTGYYRLNKDNREIPSINVELEIKSARDDIIIGSGMASCCKLVSDVKFNSNTIVILIVDGELNKFQTQYTAQGNDIIKAISVFPEDVKINYNSQDEVIAIEPMRAPQDIKGWVIVSGSREEEEQVIDEYGNEITQKIEYGRQIIFASDKPYKAGENMFENINIYIQK